MLDNGVSVVIVPQLFMMCAR